MVVVIGVVVVGVLLVALAGVADATSQGKGLSPVLRCPMGGVTVGLGVGADVVRAVERSLVA